MSYAERLEVCDTIERLRDQLESLVVRGVASAGPSDLSALTAMQADLAREGVHHLAGRVEALLDAVRGGRRDAPRALLTVLAVLRVTERVLTLETAAELLAGDDAGVGASRDDEAEA